MPPETEIAGHYALGGLMQQITDGLRAMGVDPAAMQPQDLKPVDEFHIGGAKATAELVGKLGLAKSMTVLDIGSGLGGTARVIALDTGADVTGIDLTDEYVDIANRLSDAVGLGDRTHFRTASATDLPFPDDSFDAALLLHVGMNIADKRRLFAEAARVLKPGAAFAVYDVMRIGAGDLVYPVPWAEEPGLSALASPEEYREAATSAGFEVIDERERRAYALDFFANAKARFDAGPPPLGIHLLMGRTAAEKIRNMIANLDAGRIAPVEMILRAPG